MGKIVVPLFFKGDLKEIIDKTKLAKKEGAKVIEIRGDSFLQICEKDLEKLKEISKKLKIPFILTLREKKEGGVFQIPFEKKQNLIKKAILLNFDFLDIELEFLEKLKKNAKELKGNSKTKIILSYHNFKDKVNLKKLKEIKKRMEALKPDILKFAFLPKTKRENQIILKFLKQLKKERKKSILISMGELGKRSRLETIEDNFFSYFALKDKTGPGQLTIEQLKAWKEILKLRKKLDKITFRLIEILSKRKEIVLELKKLKKKAQIQIEDKEREKKLMEMVQKLAKEKSLDLIFVKKIFKFLIENAKKIQKD